MTNLIFVIISFFLQLLYISIIRKENGYKNFRQGNPQVSRPK